MKKRSMPDETLKTVVEKNASAVMRITLHYLHFASIPMTSKFFDKIWIWHYLNNSGVYF